MGLFNSKEKGFQDTLPQKSNWLGPYEDQAIALNKTFPPQITETILDYLNPLYGFRNEVFETRISYLVGGREPRLTVNLRIDPIKYDCKYEKSTGCIKAKTTVSRTETFKNYDEVEDFSNPMTRTLLWNAPCDVTIRCNNYPKLYTERHRDFSNQDPERKRDGTKWTKEELGTNVQCIEIELDKSVRQRMNDDNPTSTAYFKTLIVIPNNLILEYWMEQSQPENKSHPFESWIYSKGTWVENQFFIFQNEGTKYTLQDEAEDNMKRLRQKMEIRGF